MSAPSLPDLEAWAIFAKVAESGSFARAAAALSLSQATVSKAISRLEARMHTTLLHRTPRGMSLTDSGHAALERASRILEEGEAVEAEVSEQATGLHGRIRVSAPMSFGLTRLAPLLPDFLLAHPLVELDVQFNDQQIDLVAERFDVALRIARLADSSLRARRLCPVRIMLVGTPAYFTRHGRPRHPSELARHQALHYTYSRGGLSWRFRHPEHGEYNQTMRVRLHANNADGLLPALMAGLGVAQQPAFTAWPLVQSGALEVVLADWKIEPPALYIVTPPGRRRPARVQAFIDHLVERFVLEPWARDDGRAPLAA
ncbi:MAG: LysR family transcriptional regulator [Pseudomonadota bacterium]|nr:LysR family transcriptional regulator [Pseudomonadota bacterium]